MSNIFNRVFKRTRIMNFGSRYEGWKEDVRHMLAEFDTWEDNAFPSIPGKDMVKRLKELKYVCLVPRLVIVKTREKYPKVGNGEKEPEEEMGLDDLLDDLLDAVMRDEDELEDIEREEEPEIGHDDMPRNREEEQRDDGISGQEPHHGECEGGGTVIVDCYGIYVGSLNSWLDWLSYYIPQSKEIIACRNDFKSGKIKDGPAVLICPELIETLYRDVIRKSSKSVRNALTLESNPLQIFLRFVLLHEIGHHVFPVFGSRSVINLSEALANWFVYWIITPKEREILHAESQMQSLPYQMYHGMLPLYFPYEAGDFSILPLLFPTVGTIAQWIEETAFKGKIGRHTVTLGYWEEFAEFIDYYYHKHYFHHFFRHPAFGHSMGAHPSHMMSLRLIREAIPQTHGRILRIIRNIAIDLKGNIRPMSKTNKQRWLDKMWQQPRGLR